MKYLHFFVLLTFASLTVFAEAPDAGMAALQNLGQLNGQALACTQMAFSGKAKALMIKHAPKTRRYGEVFEEATNASFLEQGKALDRCPAPKEFDRRLSELAARLQTTLPPTL